MPFSKCCRAHGMYLKHLSGGIRNGHRTYQCEQEEFQSNYSGWPTNIINIAIPPICGFDAYTSVSEFAQTNLSSIECRLPRLSSFSAREISDGPFSKL